jgi:hypothetical protein
MDLNSKSTALVAAGIGSAIVSAAHLAAIFIGPRAYVFLGAPQLAPMAAQGSPLPALATGLLVIIFGLWSIYAFSGAGLIRELPLLRVALLLVGLAYTVRGLLVCLDLVIWLQGRHPAPRMVAFSAISLVLGILYGVGWWRTGKFMGADRAV